MMIGTYLLGNWDQPNYDEFLLSLVLTIIVYCLFVDVYAAERARQYVVSNIRDLISAKRIKAKPEAEPCLGQVPEFKCSLHHD